jgi:hypothetical protein
VLHYFIYAAVFATALLALNFVLTCHRDLKRRACADCGQRDGKHRRGCRFGGSYEGGYE